MHVVPRETETQAPHTDLAGVPLSVVFAEGEAIEAARAGKADYLPVQPPFHLSDEDAYLVLPDDIGTEIVDILRDGDLELLHESLRDGLLVLGPMGKLPDGTVAIQVDQATTPAEALRKGLPHRKTVSIGAGRDPLEDINSLDHVQCTIVSSLVDDEGLDRILRRREYVGVSWRVPAMASDRLSGIDPTCVWSRHLGDGQVGIEMVLFQEYEELVALMRPVVLVAAPSQ